MEKTPITIKIWLAGIVPIYIAAKIHTFMTWDSGRYLARHWPFWAVMGIWTILIGVVDLVVRKRRPSLPASNPN